MNENITINIRDIQHYMYCPRRFALLNVNDDWAENAFVVKANLIHEKVHSGERDFETRSKIVRSNISVYNDDPKYDIFGVVDCIEFVRDKSGVRIPDLDGLFRVEIIEYKPTKPKIGEFNQTDAIQVYAQKICVDSIFNCSSNCFLYYSDVRRRVKLPFEQEKGKYDKMLCEQVADMRRILRNNTIPKRAKGQKCSGCSISDVCFAKEKKYDVKNIIMTMNGGDEDA